jgi:hypothetical protein
VVEKMYVSSKCPKCNGARVVTFLRVELLDMITARRPVNCMCGACNEIWPITPAERAVLEQDLPAHGATLDTQGAEGP